MSCWYHRTQVTMGFNRECFKDLDDLGWPYFGTGPPLPGGAQILWVWPLGIRGNRAQKAESIWF